MARNKRNAGKEQILEFVKMEDRQMLASITLAGNTLVIEGSNSRDIARVDVVNATTIQARIGSMSEQFQTAQVNTIRFDGLSGNDNFTNNTNIISRINGGAGNDRLVGGTNADVIFGEDGADVIFGRDGNDVVRGGNNSDRIDGGNGNDRLDGGSGHDQIFGRVGADTIIAGNGNDRALGGSDNDQIYGGAGNDTLFGETGNDKLFGQDGADTMHGNAGDDILRGGNQSDNLYGGEQSDRLFGDAGNDNLRGDAGLDVINGGANNDRASYTGNFGQFEFAGTGQQVVISVGTSLESLTELETLFFNDRSVQTANLNGGSGGNGGGSDSGDDDDSVDFEAVEREILRLLRVFRSQNGRGAVTNSSALNNFAENWSEDMGRNGFRHSTNAARAALLESDETGNAENIGFIGNIGQSADSIAEDLHNQWINSSIHRTNMLNASYDRVGIGVSLAANNRWYATVVFYG